MYPSKLAWSQVRPPEPVALRSGCLLSIMLDISHVSQLQFVGLFAEVFVGQILGWRHAASPATSGISTRLDSYQVTLIDDGRGPLRKDTNAREEIHWLGGHEILLEAQIVKALTWGG